MISIEGETFQRVHSCLKQSICLELDRLFNCYIYDTAKRVDQKSFVLLYS